MWKFQCLLFMLKWSCIWYCIIYMTIPLILEEFEQRVKIYCSPEKQPKIYGCFSFTDLRSKQRPMDVFDSLTWEESKDLRMFFIHWPEKQAKIYGCSSFIDLRRKQRSMDVFHSLAWEASKDLWMFFIHWPEKQAKIYGSFSFIGQQHNTRH